MNPNILTALRGLLNKEIETKSTLISMGRCNDYTDYRVACAEVDTLKGCLSLIGEAVKLADKANESDDDEEENFE